MRLGLGHNCFGGDKCVPYMDKWSEWCYNHEDLPLAMLPIGLSDYRQDILDNKSRNMIVKSKRHFYYMVFNYNMHLDEIYQINTSKLERQGKPMSPGYLKRPESIKVPYDLCNVQHRYVHIGGYDDSALKAYCALAIVGEIAILNTIIGHADSLSKGIMNGLIDYIVSYLETTTGVRYLNYLDMINCAEGLRSFKDSVGFRPIQVFFER
jgi:hypothetical protein